MADDLTRALESLDPTALEYEEWVEVGMALHESGRTCAEWDAWSQRDAGRYHEGECERKWRSFGNGSGEHVGAGTVFELVRRQHGGHFPTSAGDAIGWDDVGTVQAGPDVTYADTTAVPDADEGPWEPCAMLRDYLRALFDDDEHVCVVVNSSLYDDGKWHPKGGDWSRTAGELIEELSKPDATIDRVIGECEPEAGAWVCFNPLDGSGRGNANVTEYRYALVESDTLEMERQLPAIRELHLPCAAVVSSGGKSVHAIVHVDARDEGEYRNRVRWLYDYCDRHGFVTDKQNKNASRLSRLPGVVRGGRRQLLLATNIGEPDWESWKRWAEESEDDLPDDADSSDLDTPASLAPVLIEGIARQGQKIIVVGDSKMGKSTTLIDLAEAICVGGEWLGMQCAKGPVYYVNLEIDAEEFKERQLKIWDARPECDDDSWNTLKSSFAKWSLKGHAMLMKELVPRLVRRVLKRGPKGTFMAVIIDPVYKVNGGDDNDARAVAEFTNALDYVCTACGCAVIYAHHHPKGLAGGKKSMDRMSGTGVYARDADTVIDFTALDADEEIRKRFENAKLFRTTFTCRSFPDHAPLDVTFQYPRFYPDTEGVLSKCHVEGEELSWQEKNDKRKQGRIEQADNERREKIAIVREALAMCASDGVHPTRKNVLERVGEYDGKQISQGTLTAWTSKDNKRALGPFSCEKDEATNRWLIYDDHSSSD